MTPWSRRAIRALVAVGLCAPALASAPAGAATAEHRSPALAIGPLTARQRTALGSPCEALPTFAPPSGALGAPDGAAWEVGSNADVCVGDDMWVSVDLGATACADTSGVTALSVSVESLAGQATHGEDVALVVFEGASQLGAHRGDLEDDGGTTVLDFVVGAEQFLGDDISYAMALSDKSWPFLYRLDAITMSVAGDLASCTFDTDGDGLANDEETAIGTDWTNPDTDGDGVSDGDEIANGCDPLVPGCTAPTTTASPPTTVVVSDPALPYTGGGTDAPLAIAVGSLVVGTAFVGATVLNRRSLRS